MNEVKNEYLQQMGNINQNPQILSIINKIINNQGNYECFLEIKNQLLPYIMFDENEETIKIKPFDMSLL